MQSPGRAVPYMFQRSRQSGG